VVAEVAGVRLGHLHDLEGQQDRALGPLVHDDLVGLGVDEGRPGRAGVDQVHGGHDGPARVGVRRAQVGAALPELVDHGGDRGGEILGGRCVRHGHHDMCFGYGGLAAFTPQDGSRT
jgi:hypothetical protein